MAPRSSMKKGCIYFCQYQAWELSKLLNDLDFEVIRHITELEDLAHPDGALNDVRKQHEQAFQAAKESILSTTKSINAMRSGIVYHADEASTNANHEANASVGGNAGGNAGDVGGAGVEDDQDDQDEEGGVKLT